MQRIFKYIVGDLGTKEVSVLSSQDQELIKSYTLAATSFDTNKYSLDLRIYKVENKVPISGDGEVSPDNNREVLLLTDYNISDYTVEGTTVAGGPSHIVVNPVEVLRNRGYLDSVIAEFSATNNLFSPNKSADTGSYFFISEISSDRTEVRAQSTTISETALKSYVNQLYSRFTENSYFSEVYLRFSEQFLDIPCINVISEVVGDTFYVTFKLYEPLPIGLEPKTKFYVVEKIGEPSRFSVDLEIETVEDPLPQIKGPNFEIDIDQQKSGITSDYYNLEQLLSYPVSSSRYDLLSIYRQGNAELGVDFTKFGEFIHFSSAEERLENFRYKLELIVKYEKAIIKLEEASYVDPDIETYKELKNGILANFDPYERFLYFTNDSRAWPKTNTVKPYICADPADIDIPETPLNRWWSRMLYEAQQYDENNDSALVNAIPEGIKTDSLNDAFISFVYMVGQHFDEQWMYAKAIADRYDTDNRLDYGISKDLVKEALGGFGLTLQESNQNLVDLFNQCGIDGDYDPGSEVIDSFRRITLPPLQIRIFDGETASWTTPSTLINGGYVVSSGSVEGRIIGPISAVVSAHVSGTLYGTASGSFSGSYNGESYVGELTGSVYGIFDGDFSECLLSGQISASAQGTVSGSFFSGAVVDGTFAKLNSMFTENQPMTLENYRREVYKRIYHNLPYLIKTKGTTRGLRALINCFGIPDDILEISVLGNVDTQATTYVGPMSRTTSSLDRVRLATVEGAPEYISGSFESSSILTPNAETKKLLQTHSDSSHEIHVGFNLNKQVDDLFVDYLVGKSIKYDDILGDPGNTEENYKSSLGKLLYQAILDNTENLKLLRSPAGIIRLVRYIDSMLFRAIQEIVPARSELQTGVTVEDNILHRNRYKGVEPGAVEEHFVLDQDKTKSRLLEGDLKVGSITGSDSKAMDYLNPVNWNSGESPDYVANEPEFDGELTGSVCTVTDGELIKRNFWEGKLIDGNPFKHATEGRMRYYTYLRFLSLPKAATCNMSLDSTYLGKTFDIYSTSTSRKITCKVDDGLWIDGGTRNTQPTDTLDAGDRSGSITGTVDAGKATATGSGTTFTVNGGQRTSILYEYSGSKHTNQIELRADNSTILTSIFVGWYEGYFDTNQSIVSNIDKFITRQNTILVTQDTVQDNYTAKYVDIPATSIGAIPYIALVGRVQPVSDTDWSFSGSAFPTVPAVSSAKYAIKVNNYAYEAAYPVGGGEFTVSAPVIPKLNPTIQSQGFSEIVWNGRTFTPRDGMIYVLAGSNLNSLQLYYIPWIS